MDKFKQGDRYLPCVFTRICDDDPHSYVDRMPHFVSLESVKREILQNIELILNSRSRPLPDDLKNAELINSVLGFGLCDFCGLTNSKRTIDFICREIRTQLVNFEPRIKAESINVNYISDSDSKIGNTFSLEITAEYAIESLKDEFVCVSYLDLETGVASVKAKD